MEIRPILSAMLRNKTGAVLVALQVAFTLAIVVNSTFIIVKRLEFMNRDNGMDVDNIIVFQTMGFAADYNHETSLKEDRRRVAELAGVKNVTWTHQVPLSGGGSAEGFRSKLDDEVDRTVGNYYYMNEDAAKTLGVNIIKGRDFTVDDLVVMPENSNAFPKAALVTTAMEAKLFPDEKEAVGKTMYDDAGNPIQIVGVIEKMHGAWINWSELDQVVIFPGLRSGTFSNFMASVEPGTVESLVDTVEQTLAQADKTRIVRRVRPFSEIVANSYSRDRAMAIVLSFVILLLLIITTLGVIGLASFTVKQRTKQIGTRRAVGAKKIDIVRYFLTENWLITTIGVVLGAGMTVGFNMFLVQEYQLEPLNPVYVPVGILLVWVLGLIAVLGPARRASNIPPAVATRTV